MRRLLEALARHQVRATVYVLGEIARQRPHLIRRIHAEGHEVGNHGYWHRHGELEGDESWGQADEAIRKAVRVTLPSNLPYRSPYWNSTPRPGFAGGKAFRLLPKWLLKREIERQGVFWIHPHDLRSLPEWDVWYEPWHRHLLLWNPWKRLEWLLETITWR